MSLTYLHPVSNEINPENWKEALNLDNLSLDDLSTIMGDMKRMESLGKKIAGYLKEVVISRMPEGEDEYEGTYFTLERNERYREGGLNKELILEEMGEDWVEEHKKEGTEYIELRCKRKKSEED